MLVSVVFHEGYDEELRARSLATVRAQTHADWEVVGSVEEVRGDYVAFLDAGDTWSPDRLARLTAVGRPLVADRMEGVRGNGGTVLFAAAAPEIEPARLLAERALVQQVEPGPAWVLDLLLSRPDLTVTSVASIGVRRRFPDRRRALRPAPGHHRNAVLNRHLVDWTTLEMRVPAPGLTSVLVPTYEDAELTTHCVESLVAAAAADGNQIEVVVWDNGSAPDVGAALDELRSHPGVRVEHAGVNHGFALGNNLALAHAHGDLVVFLNNDTTVAPGWLTPLRAALAEPDVLAAQPLLVYPTGTIQSAGIVFPTTGGLPHELLQGFPVEDSADIGAVPLRALTGAALALRYADAVALRGFDPTYTNGLEDVDLCHRLVELRGDAAGGHFRVVADVPVVHHESRTPGRFDKHLANRQVYLDRWRGRLEPRDDVATWATRGLRVVDHEIRPRPGEPQRLAVPRPLLVRESTRLRWAIKNPAPAGEGGDRWGDTPFASSLAAALRGLGQEVVVDRRPEWARATGRHDDVALVLRGLVAPDPSPLQVTIGWVISHPEEVTVEEAHGYDRLLAAGPAWAARRTAEWGLPVEPLLQATDPDLFRPGTAAPDSGHEVLFVGNSRRVLRPVVRDALAAGLPLAVYGDLWADLVPDGVVVARSLPNAQLAAAYAGAGVVLNDHHEGMRTGGFVSNRLFDAVASGARVVTDELDGLPGGLVDLFGDAVRTYRTAADLAALVAGRETAFGDLGTRLATAERVRREHSFAARAARLIEVAHEARRTRGLTAG